jgi:hypothetical protein
MNRVDLPFVIEDCWNLKEIIMKNAAWIFCLLAVFGFGTLAQAQEANSNASSASPAASHAGAGNISPLTCEKLGCPDCSCVADKVKAKAPVLAKAISKLLQENGIPPESLVVISKTCLTRMQDKIHDASKTPATSQSGVAPALQALPDDPKCGCPNNCVGTCNGSCQPTCAFGLCVGGCW